MTLLEIERLVRKTSELLQQPINKDLAPKLAEDFAGVCHAVNLRLQQCEAMVKAGDRHQAIQLAETSPNLLDSVTVLEFGGSDEWRDYCHQNSLPVAERIDARSVHTLNECYRQGITTDHPLYAVYRSAVLGRNDDEALKALQSITRLNPADANAASELARLDTKVLVTKVQHLGNSLDRTDHALLIKEIEAIEGFGFKGKPEGEVWRKAQAIRCGCLLDEAVKLKSSSRWSDALSKIELIHQLQDELKLDLPAESLKQLGVLETWALAEREKDKKEREFHSFLAELRYRIQQSEEKDTSARYVKLPELRSDYEALHKVWRFLMDFTRPIPEDAASSFRKRSALLEAEIARRTMIHRRVIVASSATVLFIGGLIAWFVIGEMKARDLSKQLQEAVTQRQVHTTERLLERAGTQKVGSVNAVANAQTFVSKEHALKTNFEAAFSKLPQSLGDGPEATRMAGISDQLTAVRTAFNALAPDLRTENEPRLQAFEKQWQNFLSKSSGEVNSIFDQWVSSAEKQCHELDYRAPLEKATAQINGLASLVQKLSDCETGYTNNLNLRHDLLQRSASVRGKFAAYDGELKKLDRGMAAIRTARNIQDFSKGIGIIASSEFSGSPAALAATLIQSLGADDERIVRFLLGATNASSWAYVGKTKFTHFVPEIVMPAERQIFQELRSDPAIAASHQRYRLWLDREGEKTVEWIIAGNFENSIGWTKIKAWTFSSSATSATFNDHDYGFFDGQYRLSPTEPVYRLEPLGNANQTALFSAARLETVWTKGDSYGGSLLEVLDSVKDSREGSPLFKAYLFLRLEDLMNLQPDAWGLSFCPAVRRHGLQIRNIVGERFNKGDWFVPAKVNALSNKLEQLFESIRSVSYSKQAEGLLALARAVSKSGLQYVGFVGLDGKLNYLDGSTSAEVWSYSSASQQPILLATTVEAGKASKIQGLPLSPLFSFGSPRKDYLAVAGVNPGDDSFKGVLPPLFQEISQQ